MKNIWGDFCSISSHEVSNVSSGGTRETQAQDSCPCDLVKVWTLRMQVNATQVVLDKAKTEVIGCRNWDVRASGTAETHMNDGIRCPPHLQGDLFPVYWSCPHLLPFCLSLRGEEERPGWPRVWSSGFRAWGEDRGWAHRPGPPGKVVLSPGEEQEGTLGDKIDHWLDPCVPGQWYLLSVVSLVLTLDVCWCTLPNVVVIWSLRLFSWQRPSPFLARPHDTSCSIQIPRSWLWHSFG